MRFLRVAVPLMAASAASVVLAAALPDAILAGDVQPYRERMVELFSGQLPYYDFPFEHLPVMVVPLAAAWILGGWSSLSAYAFALAAVSTLCLGAVAFILRKSEEPLASPGLTIRWLLVTIPLLPFLLFRNDPFVILLAVAGLALAVEGRRGWSVAVLTGGVMAKVWPAVWTAGEWWQARRRAAAILATAAVAAVAITLSPAVQSIQRPEGLHTETLTGSLVGLARSVAGSELRITATATAYLQAPWWASAANLLVGGVLAVWALRSLRRPFSWPGAWRLTAALVGAGILAAPYFSTQYVAWVLPFTAWYRKLTIPVLAITTSSLILISTWNELFEGAIWWWALLTGRNLLLLAVVAFAVRALDRLHEARVDADELAMSTQNHASR